ncbi:MAG: hypothetical protein ABJC19_12660 [Gemmatimonadota bacterium]
MKSRDSASSHLYAPPPSRALPIATRRLVRRLWGGLRQLEREICPIFPTALALSLSPHLADCFDSIPQDQVVADLIVALRGAVTAIADLDRPIPYSDLTVNTVDHDPPA